MATRVADALNRCLATSAERWPERPSLSLDDRTLTYWELAEAVARCAGSLQEMGVGPDQRVAVLFPNCPQFVISYFAALYVGATVVPLHCLQGPEETAHVLVDSGAETLIALNTFSPLIQALLPTVPALRRVIVSGETDLSRATPFEALLAGSRLADPYPSRPEDVAVLIYTSGTTGRPKGAMLTHDNLLFDAQACAQVVSVTERDVFGTVLPLFHSFGATVCMILPILAGAHSVLIPKFTPLAVLETLERARVTFFCGVPSMYAVMLQMKTERAFDLSHLRVCVSGGAPLPVEVLYGFEERFGVRIVEGYGPTEASPVVSVNPPEGLRKVGTVGPPIPGVRVRICDDAGNEMPLGEPGEVCVVGRNVMKGYWRNPEQTAETIQNGWLRTGDIGILDEDGYLRIVDRKKDMIIVGGMNVYPREVEDVIYRLPGVAECAVVGVPNPLRGEDVKAFVVLADGAELDEQRILDHCKRVLASYKIPRTIEFRTELPKSPTGKILKRELAQQR